MLDLSIVTAEQLLAIPSDAPERLFAGTLSTAKDQYRKLATRFHPDKNPAVDHRVFAHVQVLYAAAEKRILDGTWRENGVLRLKSVKDGAEFVLRYRKACAFELGWLYYGERVAAWAVGLAYEELMRSAFSTLSRDLHYANDAMRKEHARYMPELISVVHTADRYLVVMHKTPDQYLLRDVLTYFGGRLPPRHVAWIVSSLLNTNCYLNFTGVVHNAIALDTWFVSPDNHSGALLGGWWYAARAGQRMRWAPERTLRYAPRLGTEKRADRRTDSALIKATARELLGDGAGSRLIMDSEVPRVMRDWLLAPGESDAYGEYHAWHHKVLKDAFGARRFVRLAIQPSDIYQEI